MGAAEMEEVVTTVKAILKTLECAICLELLKIPVSVGCGHFFCRQCVAGILQSSYRAPCPLCKRSFTRRSVQEAAQRQSVISAACLLANMCTHVTGVKFAGQDFVVETEKYDAGVPSKKFKSSNQENHDGPSRKRKSFENEGIVKSTVNENESDLKTKECNKENDDFLIKEHSSPNKRPCPYSDEDSGDLPMLADYFSSLPSESNVSVVGETVVEKPLSIHPTDKVSLLKTYSSAHKKAHAKNVSRIDSSSAVDSSESMRASASSLDKNTRTISVEKANENKIEVICVGQTDCDIQTKNKINALKNKTNEVQSDQYELQIEDSCSSGKNVKKKTSKLEAGDKSKENELCESPVSRSKGKFKKSSQAQLRNANMNATEGNLKDKAILNDESEDKKRSSVERDCYTLNQITLLHKQNASENQDCAPKPADDPFKSIGLTDTAITVDSVASPLATKNILLRKSPGWSRVKKVKKDFKMKKFASLPVEKNSPNVKTTTVSDQEAMSSIDKSDHFLNADVKNQNKMKSSDSVLDIATKGSSALCDRENESITSNSNKTSSMVKEICNDQVSCLNNTLNSNLNGEMCEEMDCCISNERGCDVNTSSLREVSELKVVPSVSITSNSIVHAKYSHGNEKICSQNVLKTQKIICELQKTTSFNNDLPSRDGSMSQYTVEKDSLNLEKCKNSMFGITTEIPGSLPLPTSIAEYQNFNGCSVDNENTYQYVEQSQQTSQVFNLGFQNPVYDNLRAVIPHQRSHYFCPTTEKTKVVKRTCLTLEEIQDSFAKSSQTNCPETLCSLSFLSGLFKLHINISDDTLNVSVLKVIHPISESNTAPNTSSLIPDRCVEASDSFYPPTAPEVVPSSNAASESSQPDTLVDPFPYLKKDFNLCSSLPNEAAMNLEATVKDNIETAPDEMVLPTVIRDSEARKSSGYKHGEEDFANEEIRVPEIVHFPSNPVDKCNKNVLTVTETLPCIENSKHSHLEIRSPSSVKCDLPMNKRDCSLFSSANLSLKQNDSLSSDEESLKKLKQCVQLASKKKQGRLSLKKTLTLKELDVAGSSYESDSETVSKSDKVIKLASAMKIASSPKESNSFKETVHHSIPLEMSSTLSSSCLTEDTATTTEGNTTDIILEIEDLSCKIKSLEEQLQLCGHDDGGSGGDDDDNVEIEKSENADSGSEDSTDLFPQTVPPTPPNRI